MLLTGSQIIIEVLIEKGVDTVFGYPGGHVLHIYDELEKNKTRIKHILAAHEQGASHAADGYARASGKVGVCLSTSGPGATNIVTGLATALADSVPIVAITGNVPLKFAGTDSFQEIDAISLTVAVTKHSFFVRNVEDLAETLREAFHIAKSGRPGPVLVDIPQDVQMGLCGFKNSSINYEEKIEIADKESMEGCIELINTAEKPVIYCGGGVINGGCEKELIDLAERLDAFVACSMMGASIMNAEHPLYLGMSGVYGRRSSSMAIAESDLIIAVGVRFADRGTGNKENFGKHAKIIHLDIDNAEQGKIIKADKYIVGDLKHSLEFLINNSEKSVHESWHCKIEEIKRLYGEEINDKKLFKPKEIIEEVNRILPKETVIATDVGQHQMWVAKHYSFSKPRTFLTSGGFGTMGYGMGAAIGAALANEKRTVLFTGDGSFHMNMNEISTAVRHGIPVTVIVLNNGKLGMIEQLQAYFYENNIFSTDLNYKTDFKRLAESMGAKGFRATNIEEIKEALMYSLDFSGPVVIDCIISGESRAVPMMKPNGSVYDMIIR